jgi:hypothetical protein
MSDIDLPVAESAYASLLDARQFDLDAGSPSSKD